MPTWQMRLLIRAARRHHRKTMALERSFQLHDQLANQPAIAMHGAHEHRLLGALANRTPDFANADARQERRLLVQVIGHRGQPGSDDAAYVIASTIHNIEGHRRAKINY